MAADLEGGGSVVFLEFAAPVDHPVAGQVAEQWRTAAGEAEFEEVRRAAQMIDAGYRKSTPWWGRCDLNEAHIRRAADGRLVLIDVFCMDGASLYREILNDVAGVHRRIPRERMRYALDIPYIARAADGRRDPCPQKGLGTRCRIDHFRYVREQPPMRQPLPNNGAAAPVSPHPGSGNLRQIGARSPRLPWSLSVLSTGHPDACRSGLDCSVGARQKLWTARSCTARHGFPRQGQF